MRYRPNTPLVLQGVSFTILEGEHIGVVGRTGSGKSSLSMALFRIVELERGTIFVDDVDISRLGIDKLRRNMKIVPQDPFIFKGTVKYNLDPFNTFEDEKLKSVLRSVKLDPELLYEAL